MISRIISKRLIPLATATLSSISLFKIPQFNFAKIEKVSNIKKIIDAEIKAEEEAKNDLS